MARRSAVRAGHVPRSGPASAPHRPDHRSGTRERARVRPVCTGGCSLTIAPRSGALEICASDRVLVLAPHPDDETLGAGGLLLRASDLGAPVRVVFVTDGDDNPWPQRVLEHRVRIDAIARARWGARRRSEACAALRALGVRPCEAVFLGFPDQGLTQLLLTAPHEVAGRIAHEIAEWRPTIVAMPALVDRHPDHSAVAVLSRAALAAVARDIRPTVLMYVVHPLGADIPGGVSLRLDPDERARKRRAIDRHVTQLVFHRRSYSAAALCDDQFQLVPWPYAPTSTQTMRARSHAAVSAGTLRVTFGRGSDRFAVLSIIGWDAHLMPVARRALLAPGRRIVALRDAATGASVGRAFRAGGFVDVPLPTGTAALDSCFVAVTPVPVRRGTSGWIEAVRDRVPRIGDAPRETPSIDARAPRARWRAD